MDVVKYIGSHECSNIPQSLSDDNGKMRSGNKAILVKAIKVDTEVESEIELPISAVHTVIIVDAMSMIRRLSFKKEMHLWTFLISLDNITQGTQSIHFCCDRYRKTNMKTDERHNRSGKFGSAKVYEIDDRFNAPDPGDFFAVDENKCNLLNYLCEKWCTDEIRVPTLSSIRIYMGGGFK